MVFGHVNLLYFKAFQTVVFVFFLIATGANVDGWQNHSHSGLDLAMRETQKVIANCKVCAQITSQLTGTTM